MGYNNQLLQTPSKIYILALLMNSSAHRESMMRVLDQDFVECDMPIDQFSNVVGNITSCNNLSFCNDELPDEGRNHNMALHISMNCKNDSLSNVLIDNGSALNVYTEEYSHEVEISRNTYAPEWHDCESI